jgi:nucleoid-associated protein YgaU
MRSTFVCAIGMGLLAGLIAGCEGKKAQTFETAPPPPPVAETPTYPAETMAPAPAPAPVTAAPPSDVYMPPPAEETIPIPPEEEEPVVEQRSTRRTTVRPAPRNNYASTAKKTGQTYTVRKGDTLQKISQRFYGTTRQWRKIYEANRRTLKGNPEKIYPGMKLTIPPK